MYVVQSIYFDQYQLYQVIGIPHALTFPLGNDLNYCRPNLPCNYLLYSPRGHLYFRLDIILVKGLSKHTLNTYFPGMKIDPKYAFLHVFFLIFRHLFPKFMTIAKNTPFFPILDVFAPLNDVRAYIAWS